MTYKGAIADSCCLCLTIVDDSMLFLTLFWLFLLINALSAVDSHRSFNDLPRREIIEILETGRPTTGDDFKNALTDILIRNNTNSIDDVELAFYISAIIARDENPRNVRGADLVSDLLRRVDQTSHPQPYLIVTLCNARAVTHRHLDKIVKRTALFSNYTRNMRLETDAQVLLALACSASLPNAHKLKLDRFTENMIEIANRIARTNGYYGNVYTTSLVAQALTAFNHVVDAALDWSENQALDFLRRESSAAELTKKYYITLALNARRVPFLKELSSQNYANEIVVKKDITVTLVLRNELVPEDGFGMLLQVPEKWNLFELLMKASNISSRFQFSYHLKNGQPVIFEVDNYPNDPEVGISWYICIKMNKVTETYFESPSSHSPVDEETIVLWYRRTECPNF